MLKYCDSFDHASWAAFLALGWTTDQTATVVAGTGRWGGSALRLTYYQGAFWSPPTISRLCNKIMIGFAYNAVNGPLAVQFFSTD